MYYLLINRFYISINIYISDKYRTTWKKKIAVGNENRKNIKTEQKKTKILQNYHDSLPLPIILHTLRIFWKKKSKHE